MRGKTWDRFIFATPARAVVFVGLIVSAWIASHILRDWVWPPVAFVPGALLLHYLLASLWSRRHPAPTARGLLTWHDAKDTAQRTPIRMLTGWIVTVLVIAACVVLRRTFWVLAIIPAELVAWYVAANLLAARDAAQGLERNQEAPC